MHIFYDFRYFAKKNLKKAFNSNLRDYSRSKGRKLTYRDLILKDLDIEDPEDIRDLFLDRKKWQQHVARIKRHSHKQYLHNQTIQKAKRDEYKRKTKQAKTK